MTTQQYRLLFREKAKVWFKAQTQVKLMKTRDGEVFAVVTVEDQSIFPKTWKFLFDTQFDIFNVINFEQDCTNEYRLADFALSRKIDAIVALYFNNNISHCVCRFNEEKQLIQQSVYQQVYIYFDDSNTMQLVLGHSHQYDGSPYQKTVIGTFPLQRTDLDSKVVTPRIFESDNFEWEPSPSPLESAREKEEAVIDIADRDLSDREILLYFAERGFA